jgi:hypothetical protein
MEKPLYPGRELAPTWALGFGLLLACHHGAASESGGGQGQSAGQEQPAPPEESSPVTDGVQEGPVDDGKMSCANVRCMAGTHCEMVQVQCIRAPCDPVPECKPDAP